VGYPHHQFFAATDWDVGEYGLALLSRHPLTQPRITRLPILPGIEPRILASAVVALPCGPLSVHVTHLSHRPSEAGLRARQVAHIRDVLARDPLPRVLAGDFNDLPGSDAHRGVTAALVDLFDAAGEGAPGTFPLPVPFLPPLRIDYVFASAEIRPRRTHVVETAASDHHLLLAHVEYRGAREQAAGEAA
jgi:endonuclease/exonuclease/phosphatase family metal-dependent hydrolase